MGYRAVKPLDPGAVAAANAAVYPQTGGRKLTTGPKDAELREIWMRAYMDAGGKVKKITATGKKPKGCIGPCPKDKTVIVRVVSLTFRSDHLDGAGKKLLKKAREVAIKSSWVDEKGELKSVDADSMFSDDFEEYAKPEWDIARGGSSDAHPISHTMDQHVKIDLELEFEVTPAGESAQITKILGSSASRLLSFDKDISRTVKNTRIKLDGLKSKSKLDKMVQLIEDSIEWTVVVDGEEKKAGSTGTHKIYVTFDTPSGQMASPINNDFAESGPVQIITDARLEYSVKAAEHWGGDDERECVDEVFEEMRRRKVGYYLGHRWETSDPTKAKTFILPVPTLHHYLWLCNLRLGLGECHNIAASFALACRILGVKKSFDVGYMYPWPGRKDNHPGYDRGPARSGSGKNVLGKLNASFTRDHSSESGHGTERMFFVDGRGKGNNFEGVLTYDGRALYAIGDDIFDRFPDPHDNSSEYYGKRDARPAGSTGDFRSPPSSFDTGAFKLSFLNTTTFARCSDPYAGNTAEQFKWEE